MGGLLTKVGIYALLRTLIMLLPVAREHLAPVLLAIAMATAILGPLSAIGETNLRRAIGFLLIGGVGLTLLSVPTIEADAVAGSVAYGIHAMLSLTALYMIAGLIERATGQVDTRHMRGLYAANSTLSLLFLVLILAVSGVPPFLGFWPKLLLLQGFMSDTNWLPLFTVLLNALLTLIAGTRLWSHIFWRGTAEKAAVPFRSLAATWLLTAVIVLLGLGPSLVIDTARAAALSLLNPDSYITAVGLAP
jgi:multicomponent Na+:H+ antiporter subunit D